MTPSSRDLLDLRCHSRGIRLSQWQNANGVQGFHVFSQTLVNGNYESRLTLDGISVVELGDPPNTPPIWTTNPVNKIDATVGVPYSGTLAEDADDTDADDTLEFIKISGPAWLNVAADGTLSGTPTNEDVGSNAFTVSVTDGITAPVQAALNITVHAASSPFDAWAASGSNGAVTFSGDHNGDGISDGLAFLLGAADPDANALALLPNFEKTNDGLILTFRLRNAATRGTATATIQWSSDLGVTDLWAGNSAVVPESNQIINGATFQITPDGDFNEVIVTIPSSEGKLFGRISGTEN